MRRRSLFGIFHRIRAAGKRRALQKPPVGKIIDIVELGPGHKAKGMLPLLTRPGIEVHGIDRALRDEEIRRNGGVLRLRQGSFHRVLKRHYGQESVRQFRMSIVLSYQGKPARMARKYRKVFRQVFEKLVPGGTLSVSEEREHLRAVKPVLESLGFEVTEPREARPDEIGSFWQKVYAGGGVKRPWLLTATKPAK